MRNILGNILTGIGVICFIIFGILDLVITLGIVNKVVGFWGCVVGFTILPATFAVAPWYALIAWGNWFPLLVVYGGGILTAIFWGGGQLIKGEI